MPMHDMSPLLRMVYVLLFFDIACLVVCLGRNVVKLPERYVPFFLYFVAFCFFNNCVTCYFSFFVYLVILWCPQIPFHQITDCVIHEGQTLGNRVRIQTTAATSSILLAGVQDPVSLQKLVFAMKRSSNNMHAHSRSPIMMMMNSNMNQQSLHNRGWTKCVGRN
jgi:hypothetical protein